MKTLKFPEELQHHAELIRFKGFRQKYGHGNCVPTTSQNYKYFRDDGNVGVFLVRDELSKQNEDGVDRKTGHD